MVNINDCFRLIKGDRRVDYCPLPVVNLGFVRLQAYVPRGEDLLGVVYERSRVHFVQVFIYMSRFRFRDVVRSFCVVHFSPCFDCGVVSFGSFNYVVFMFLGAV